jgi:Ca-activated chloride channel family protein
MVVENSGFVIVDRAEKKPVLLRLRRNRPVLFFCALMAFALPRSVLAGGWEDFWFTPDQQGQRLSREGRYLEAAKVYETPEYRGVAYFQGGDFESAASVFGRLTSPEAAFNRGNSLLMLGRYDEAIAGYQAALVGRPDWLEASENLAIAKARKEMLAPPDDDAGGTGGQLEADEIVFDDSGRVNKSGTEIEADGGEEMSDDEMRAVWLRRIQNDPAEFLRSRFAYQLYRDQEQDEKGGDDPITD